MKPTLASFRLISALRLRSALPVAVLMGSAFVGCADESDPATWVKRLDDVAKRSESVKRIGQMYEDRMSKASGDRSNADVAALAKLASGPLATTYATAGIDEKTRMEIIKLLADIQDPSALPAFSKALAIGGNATPEELRDAARGITAIAKAGGTIPADVADALWARFAASKPSQLKSIQAVRALTEAVVAVKAPSYAPKAAAMLRLPMTDDPNDKADVLQYAQQTAAHVLGELKSPEGARALVACLLDPKKGAVAPTFVATLRKTPDASELALVGALTGSDAEFLAMSSALPSGEWRSLLAEALSSISRPAGRDAVISVLDKAATPADRTALTLTLVNFPPNKASVDAFLASYKKIPADALFGVKNARGTLMTVAPALMDPALVPWLEKEVADAKGDFADELHKAAFYSLFKMMAEEDLATVGGLVSKFYPDANSTEKKAFDASAAVVNAAKKDAAAYIKELTRLAGPENTLPFGATKAAWMAGIYGNDNTRADLVQAYTSGKAVTLPTLSAIDHLAPNGDEISAKAIEAVIGKRPGILAIDDAAAKLVDKLRARKSK